MIINLWCREIKSVGFVKLCKGEFWRATNLANRVTKCCGTVVVTCTLITICMHALQQQIGLAEELHMERQRLPIDSAVRGVHSGAVLVSSNRLLNPLLHCSLMC